MINVKNGGNGEKSMRKLCILITFISLRHEFIMPLHKSQLKDLCPFK